MKVRAQIGMVLNLDKCIGCDMTASPRPSPAGRAAVGDALLLAE
jgi:hypothetical protein